MILLIKYMVQTVRVFVHPVLLSLSRGKRLYILGTGTSTSEATTAFARRARGRDQALCALF